MSLAKYTLGWIAMIAAPTLVGIALGRLFEDPGFFGPIATTLGWVVTIFLGASLTGEIQND